MPQPDSQPIQLFVSPDGQARLEVALQQETVWLSQAQMCELFGRDQSVVSRHASNVFKEGELPAEGNMQKVHIAGSDKPVTLYSLGIMAEFPRSATGAIKIEDFGAVQGWSSWSLWQQK